MKQSFICSRDSELTKTIVCIFQEVVGQLKDGEMSSILDVNNLQGYTVLPDLTIQSPAGKYIVISTHIKNGADTWKGLQYQFMFSTLNKNSYFKDLSFYSWLKENMLFTSNKLIPIHDYLKNQLLCSLSYAPKEGINSQFCISMDFLDNMPSQKFDMRYHVYHDNTIGSYEVKADPAKCCDILYKDIPDILEKNILPNICNKDNKLDFIETINSIIGIYNTKQIVKADRYQFNTRHDELLDHIG